MERVCFLARIRPERLGEYRKRHKHVYTVFRWVRGVEMAGFFVSDGADVLPDQSFLRIAEVFHLDEEYTPNA